ncbi:zinc-ribbon and DUF3426 domain-containing protein [Piscinibacter sp. XHJ-5]|uniref:zinc-ribbon and DUF3426 domain-containing protein n=1 Tax=Piscinibacter sp. XHJ-5 TaxID=3037797 RepID=UPI002452F21D|nr:zinc-ribbon and DUF3426 domain-containing protein [Piscinibacter sp. XHJ-5]
MSMATRCVACGTIFRVVQDQLKVSEGWVRCGRCDEVFNALEGLFDLERESPPPWQPGQAKAARPDDGFEKTAADLDEEDRIASRFFRPEQDDVDRTPAEAVDERDRTDFADARFEDDEDPAETRRRKPAIDPDAPTFVREAQQQEARRRSPRARLGLLLACLLLGSVLAVQGVHHFHDHIAAQFPAMQPLLARWCAHAGCAVEAPRRIEDVSVESTALTHAATGTDSYRLSVTLRNRGALPVSMPSVDLTLTDSAGQLVARRALNPADFRVASPVLPPGAEAALQVLLAAGNPRVSGYTVEVFYP